MKKIREYKNYFLCKCPNPEHNDSHPSAILWKDSGNLICMSCGYREKFHIEDLEDGWFDFSVLDEEFKYYPLSNRGIEYLKSRGVFKIPGFVFSNSINSGVSLLQTNVSGKPIGLKTRLFVPLENNMRYSYEGRKSFFSGNLRAYFDNRNIIIAFEKTFAMLRATQIDSEFIPICTNGSNVNPFDWHIIPKSDIIFVFDNDIAGQRAKNKMKDAGFIAFVSKSPTDEIGIDKLERLINNVKSLVLR